MATVFAKSNGNWTDTTLWAFWNESTQQIEDYGQVPQVDDVVYLNGFRIALSNNLIINVNKITSNVNPYTSNSGGYFTFSNATITINGDIEVYFNTTGFFYLSGSGVHRINVNGNVIQSDSTFGLCYTSQTYSSLILVINGNLTIESGSLKRKDGLAGTGFSFTLNGNLLSSTGDVLITGPYGDQNITTKYDILGNASVTSAFVNSDMGTAAILITGTFTVTAFQNLKKFVCNHIRYRGKFPLILYYLTCDETFDCIQLDEPNPNPYIIVNPNTIAQTYPTEDKVLAPTQYGAQMELVGQYTPDYPPESVVLKDYEYGDSDDRKTGTMEQEVNVEVGCVTPEDVRKDVPLVGMGVVGSLVVPSVDDVREGVVFDNGSVGTLIVQGGGDRLRIADFGYYTNAQSDTYIVDLTEQDKPKFAVAEERVLIEMFPDLDLDNIPEKYFDDLFVKYLKYRLIVEYYRTAGINSTFSPSEPTTEIVNYQNVRNEVWLNSANIYLKAWSKKYPESITKPQRILL